MDGVLFGLAIDYQMFVVSGMRESYIQSGDARRASPDGYSHGARVVIGAAIIMMAVFGGFVFSEVPNISANGFALAVGICRSFHCQHDSPPCIHASLRPRCLMVCGLAVTHPSRPRRRRQQPGSSKELGPKSD
ncbi:MMPL family transporter [Arthrobacter sp. CAN_C5]|uniref:MMPL family transporter n=1 Tax=Arthrobacter sp. CAN_C5 TaxID=2760706 RepID=UPI001AEAE889|nr:MMPL family transporter [Arthrobacter sp. CAN_C5]MBP2216550.1 hypothetical protein [Arthrobacter sp. CAN_C5]